MPTTTSITTTYAGEFAGKYVSAALLSSPTLANGLITIKPNVKYKEVLKRFALGDVLADATCDFTDTSSVTLTERILQPKELQVNLELCKTPFQSDWEAVSMGYSAHDVLPKNFQDYLIAELSAKVAQNNEINIWRGVAGAGAYNGFATLLATDAGLPTAQEIASASVTSANVIAELGKIVDAIPATLYGRDDLYIYVSQNIFRAYVRALGGFGANGLGGNGTNAQGTQWYGMGNELMFDGVKIVMVNGLANNTAIATYKENLYFGTGLLADHNEVKILDMADIDGSKNVRFVMRMTAGVQYSIVEDIVTYGITNTAN